MNNARLCRNLIFWKGKHCHGPGDPESGLRCSGNYPGQCRGHFTHSRFRCVPVKSGVVAVGECRDKSHLVCKNVHRTNDNTSASSSASRSCDLAPNACDLDFMRMCANNATCIHRDLFCDGHDHCPDKSDEDEVSPDQHCKYFLLRH